MCQQRVQGEDTSLHGHTYSKPTAPVKTLSFHGGHRFQERDIFYTGQRADVFIELVKVVPQLATTHFMTPVEAQLFLTLMKLRLGLIYADLSRRFGICELTVGNIFRAMLATFKLILESVVVWLSIETVFRNLP